MKLSDITADTKIIKDFSKRLATSTKEVIVSTIVGKAKRTSGISTIPVDFNMENGQLVTIYTRIITQQDVNYQSEGKSAKKNQAYPPTSRDMIDIFRVDINNKQMPTTGDFDNSYKPSFNKAVDEVADFVKNGQVAFDKKRSAVKVAPTKNNNNSLLALGKQIQALQQKAKELDVIIESKRGELKVLEGKLAASVV